MHNGQKTGSSAQLIWIQFLGNCLVYTNEKGPSYRTIPDVRMRMHLYTCHISAVPDWGLQKLEKVHAFGMHSNLRFALYST